MPNFLLIDSQKAETVENCARIYLLENGRIVKSGSYQEVILEKTAT